MGTGSNVEVSAILTPSNHVDESVLHTIVTML